MTPIFTIGSIPVYRDGSALTFTAGAAIDDDGDPAAYNLHSGGHDALGNAHADPHDLSSRYVGVVVHNGQPVVLPGGWLVSTTAWSKPGGPPDDPASYLNAQAIAYGSIPPELKALSVGAWDFMVIGYKGREVAGVVGDIGPHKKLGEISPAAARAVGIDDSPRHGGVDSGVSYTIWPGSSKGWPVGLDLAAEVARLRATVTAT